MKKILAIILIISPLYLYCQPSSVSYDFIPLYSTVLASENGDKMMNQCSRSVPENIDKYFDLTKENIELLESNFRKILAIKSTGCCFNGWEVENLENYGFQYIGVEINNRKYIYLNAFIIDGDDDFTNWYKNWKVAPIVMCDGGDGFWGVLFDLETQNFSQLSINGI